MSDFDFQTALKGLPDQPGVYRMKSDSDEILYVGKAKNLKNRVRSYFQNPAGLAPKVAALMQQVTHFDTIMTDSEVEALILECNLIKKHRPKYNILLKDDKRFPWIGLSNDPFPRLFITRNPNGRARFFGPYVNSNSLYKTLQVIKTHFPLRQRPKPLFKTRPCMNYYIGACPAPCQKLIEEEDYSETVRQVTLFLKGKADDLLDRLASEMALASERMNFEQAARLRDRYRAVQEIVAQQKVYYSDASMNQDIIAMACDERRCTIIVMGIRRGKLIGFRPHEIRLQNHSKPEEAYETFIMQFYQDEEKDDLPDEIVLQQPLEDEILLQDWLSGVKGRRVTMHLPQKGIKKDLLTLGQKNAQEALEQAKLQDLKSHSNDPVRALIALQQALHLPTFPERMECYDISHFQGSETVASMVVFTQGAPDKKEYRRFKIQSAEGEPDDFKSMHEVITRRFSRAVKAEIGWAVPQLVIIDGGKGQLSSAVAALKSLEIQDQPIISLAKKFEEVFFPEQSRPIILPRDSSALFLLQQIRDEAHRFAITYHRQLRGKKATVSTLDGIPGMGEKRKAKLLAHFGNLTQIKAASLEELSHVPGLTLPLAKQVYQTFHESI